MPSKLKVASDLWKTRNSLWDEVVIFNIFIIEETFEDFYQHEPWINYGKAIWIECVFYVDSFFLFVATAQKLAYRWIRYKTLKVLCFSLPWKWQNVKSKQKVQEILWKQSLETFCMKKVIISNYRQLKWAPHNIFKIFWSFWINYDLLLTTCLELFLTTTFDVGWFEALVWSLWKILLILRFQTRFIYCSIFNGNIYKTKEK